MNTTRWAALMLLFISLTACQDDLKKEVVSTYPNEEPRVVHYYSWLGNKKVLKKEVRYYNNGQKDLEVAYKNGKKHGLWEQWYPNGEQWMRMTYENGIKNGPATVWFQSGKKNYTAHYKNGLPHGEWVYYDGSGHKTKRAIYEEGELIEEEALD